MPILLIAALVAASHPPQTRIERLVRLAQLDGAVHYFDPGVATRPSAWDSLFAANVVAIADAPMSAEYARLIGSMMTSPHAQQTQGDSPSTTQQRALVYNGFPTASMQSSGGYTITWRAPSPNETYRVDMAEGKQVDVAVTEPGVPSGDYRIGLDRSVPHGGSASSHLAARVGSPSGFGVLSQVVKAEQYRGKRIRFSAYAKTRNAANTGLWMRVDGNGGMLAFDNMMNRPLRGTMDWTRASVVLDVPMDADGIAFGMILSGDDAWIDDASLEVVGSDVASTNAVTPSPNPSNAEAMRKNYQNVRASAGNLGFEPH